MTAAALNHLGEISALRNMSFQGALMLAHIFHALRNSKDVRGRSVECHICVWYINKLSVIKFQPLWSMFSLTTPKLLLWISGRFWQEFMLHLGVLWTNFLSASTKLYFYVNYKVLTLNFNNIISWFIRICHSQCKKNCKGFWITQCYRKLK